MESAPTIVKGQYGNSYTSPHIRRNPYDSTLICPEFNIRERHSFCGFVFLAFLEQTIHKSRSYVKNHIEKYLADNIQ